MKQRKNAASGAAGATGNLTPQRLKPIPPSPLDLELRPGQSIELLKELHILTRGAQFNLHTRNAVAGSLATSKS